jgi:hypothetical protein
MAMRIGNRPLCRSLGVAVAALSLAACTPGASAGPVEKPGPSLTRTPTFITPTGTYITPSGPPETPTRTPPRTPTPHPTPSQPACPSRPLMGVYEPQRLHVLAQCVVFIGTVARIEDLPDDDVRVDLMPEPRFRHFLNDANQSALHGWFPAVMIFGQPQAFILPDVGDRMYVRGTLVTNLDRGWNEMHPVWEVRFGGVTIYAEPPVPPLHDLG